MSNCCPKCFSKRHLTDESTGEMFGIPFCTNYACTCHTTPTTPSEWIKDWLAFAPEYGNWKIDRRVAIPFIQSLLHHNTEDIIDRAIRGEREVIDAEFLERAELIVREGECDRWLITKAAWNDIVRPAKSERSDDTKPTHKE